MKKTKQKKTVTDSYVQYVCRREICPMAMTIFFYDGAGAMRLLRGTVPLQREGHPWRACSGDFKAQSMSPCIYPKTDL